MVSDRSDPTLQYSLFVTLLGYRENRYIKAVSLGGDELKGVTGNDHFWRFRNIARRGLIASRPGSRS